MCKHNLNNKVILLLGSNMGNRVEFIQFGIEELQAHAGNIKQQSSLYESESWGYNSYAFINLAVIITTALGADDLLNLLKDIEKKAGRFKSNKQAYEDRTLDIDILFFNNQVIKKNHLQIPHPRLQERNFALKPLNEIVPDYVHPVLHKSIHQLLAGSSDKSRVTVFKS